MTTDSENPASNILKAGLTEPQLQEAIRSSGYPLQVFIASILRPDFFVQEEWGFRDAGTDTIRTVDLLAERWFRHSARKHLRVRPTLNLIVECKQSDLPYVFFLTDTPLLRNYPLLAGLHKDTISITTDDDRSTWHISALEALGLLGDPFLHSSKTCTTFSKCVRHGKDVELSGTEAYNALVMPLAAAVTDFKRRSKPPSTAYFFDARVVLGVGALDAPMVGVIISPAGPTISFLPWVRVVRNAPSGEPASKDYIGEYVVLDIVHKDYFNIFLERHVQPFMERFRDGACGHDEELAEGKGFVSGMGRDPEQNIEQRMRPSTFSVPPPVRVYRGWRGVQQMAGLIGRYGIGTLLFRLRRMVERRGKGEL